MILAVIVEHAAGNSVGMQPALPDHRPLAYVNEDFSQANNLAEKNPAKLKELQDAPSSTKLSGLRVNGQDLSARVAGGLRSSTANQEWPCASGNESSPLYLCLLILYLPEIVYTECGRQKENHQQGRSDSRVIAEQFVMHGGRDGIRTHNLLIANSGENKVRQGVTIT